MKKTNQLSKSAKKFIARQKAQIRRQFSDSKKQAEAIAEIYKNILKSSADSVKPEKAKEAVEEKKEQPKAKTKKAKK